MLLKEIRLLQTLTAMVFCKEITFYFRISEENVLIESLLLNRTKIGKIGRPVFNASGNHNVQ